MECYAYRMLNPYRGVVQVIEHEDGAVESTDGLRWTIYVRSRRAAAVDEPGVDPFDLQEVRYATWSAGHGLRRLPMRNPVDVHRIEAVGRELLKMAKAHAPSAPFRLEDVRELWLVDEAGQPLALIDSARPGEPLGNPDLPQWRAGVIAAERFDSPHRPRGARGERPSRWLEEVVNDAACGARWFRRHADGAGVPEGGGDRLPATEFPQVLLRGRWAEPAASALAADYFAWLASRLLQLRDLSDELRADLERFACSRPEELAERRALVPRFVERDRVNAALVEARLRAAAGEKKEPEPASTELFPFVSE